MERTLDAIYENGALVPLEPVDLPEHQRLRITIHVPTAEDPEAALQAWRAVYANLSDAEIAELEAVALDRSRFMASR
jgi:predicted DNA-binding antitoxin AbrB/MazE fold protein